jgi:hypothetical protein
VHLTDLDRLLWALCLAGHVILLAVLLLRRRAAVFPIFTTLIAVNIFRTVLLYFTLRLGTSETYFYTYWTLAVVDVALQLAVAYELATHVFQPLGAWAPDVRRSFLVIGIVSVLIALSLTWLGAPPTHKPRLAIILRGEFFSSVVLSELLVAMVAMSVTLGLPWRTHVARLAQGLGVYSTFGILTDAAHSYFGSSRGNGLYKSLAQFQIVLYLACLGYWTVTLARKEPAPRKLPEHLHEELCVLQRKAALMLKSLRTLGSTS